MIEDFNKVIDLRYDEFLKKLDEDNTSEYHDLLLLAKAAMEHSFPAIKLSFNRIEGLQETPVEFDIPKFFVRYVNATEAEGAAGELPEPTVQDKKKDTYDPAVARLRETLAKMRSLHKDVPAAAMKAKQAIEGGADLGDRTPSVKAIICANLILLSRQKVNVIEFVFDQIYGKLVQKIKLLNGEDVYVDNYHDKIAPAGSYQDENGVWVKEDKAMQMAVIAGFSRMGGKYLGLKEYLDDEL